MADAGFTARRVREKPHSEPAENPSREGSRLPIDLPPALNRLAERAHREGTFLVIDFHADWCVPCSQMEKETWQDPTVKHLLSKGQFLAIDTDAQPKLARLFGVRGIPDIRLYGPRGRERFHAVGYRSPEEMTRLLRTAIQEIGKGAPGER